MAKPNQCLLRALVALVGQGGQVIGWLETDKLIGWEKTAQLTGWEERDTLIG